MPNAPMMGFCHFAVNAEEHCGGICELHVLLEATKWHPFSTSSVMLLSLRFYPFVSCFSFRPYPRPFSSATGDVSCLRDCHM